MKTRNGEVSEDAFIYSTFGIISASLLEQIGSLHATLLSRHAAKARIRQNTDETIMAKLGFVIIRLKHPTLTKGI